MLHINSHNFNNLNKCTLNRIFSNTEKKLTYQYCTPDFSVPIFFPGCNNLMTHDGATGLSDSIATKSDPLYSIADADVTAWLKAFFESSAYISLCTPTKNADYTWNIYLEGVGATDDFYIDWGHANSTFTNTFDVAFVGNILYVGTGVNITIDFSWHYETVPILELEIAETSSRGSSTSGRHPTLVIATNGLPITDQVITFESNGSLELSFSAYRVDNPYVDVMSYIIGHFHLVFNDV